MTPAQSAKAKGERMGALALAKANRNSRGWSDNVMTLLRLYARNMGDTDWTGEDFRLWAHSKGLATSGDNRAFGPLVKKAVRDGIICRTGYSPTISSNGSVRATYRRAQA